MVRAVHQRVVRGDGFGPGLPDGWLVVGRAMHRLVSCQLLLVPHAFGVVVLTFPEPCPVWDRFRARFPC